MAVLRRAPTFCRPLPLCLSFHRANPVKPSALAATARRTRSGLGFLVGFPLLAARHIPRQTLTVPCWLLCVAADTFPAWEYMTGIGTGRSVSRRGRSRALIRAPMLTSLHLLGLLRLRLPIRIMFQGVRRALCHTCGIRPLAYLAGSLLCFGPCFLLPSWRFFSITLRAASLSLRNKKGPEGPSLDPQIR